MLVTNTGGVKGTLAGASGNGSTTHFTGTATTTAANVPTTAAGTITTALVRCSPDQNKNNRLKVSFDGGAGFITLSPGEFIGWSVKGGEDQVVVETDANTADYEIVLNRAT